jgi:hypothetical protein
MGRSMRRGLAVWLTVSGLAIAAPVALLPAAAGASTRHEFQGPIISVNRDKHTFRMTDEPRGPVKIKASMSTRFERLSGFGALHMGLRVDVKAHRKDGRWIADKIEPKS